MKKIFRGFINLGAESRGCACTDMTEATTVIEGKYCKASNQVGVGLALWYDTLHTVKGDILPIQIIDNRQLSMEDNIWLRCLHNDLNLEMVTRVGEEVGRKPKGANIEAYINVVLEANTERVEEIIRMSRQKKTLEEVLVSTGLAAKWEARKEAEFIESAKRALEKGYPIETVQDITGLDLKSLGITTVES